MKQPTTAMKYSRVVLTTGLIIMATVIFDMFLSDVPAQDSTVSKAKSLPQVADSASIDRTRLQIKMLDDIYKGGIVLVTTHYVNDKSDLAAGTAFQKLFSIAKDNGWHEVRLLDATGDPYESNNSPREGFEKESVAQLLKGKTWVERVVEEDGKQFLFASTPIPVVTQKCVLCHEHYATVPNGTPIGALSYKVPLIK